MSSFADTLASLSTLASATSKISSNETIMKDITVKVMGFSHEDKMKFIDAVKTISSLIDVSEVMEIANVVNSTPATDSSSDIAEKNIEIDSAPVKVQKKISSQKKKKATNFPIMSPEELETQVKIMELIKQKNVELAMPAPEKPKVDPAIIESVKKSPTTFAEIVAASKDKPIADENRSMHNAELFGKIKERYDNHVANIDNPIVATASVISDIQDYMFGDINQESDALIQIFDGPGYFCKEENGYIKRIAKSDHVQEIGKNILNELYYTLKQKIPFHIIGETMYDDEGFILQFRYENDEPDSDVEIAVKAIKSIDCLMSTIVNATVNNRKIVNLIGDDGKMMIKWARSIRSALEAFKIDNPDRRKLHKQITA